MKTINCFVFVMLLVIITVKAYGSSSFQRISFDGISIEAPKHWIVINKNTMKQIDTNTELMMGVDQSNNNILIAANWYRGNDRSDADATMRLSIRYVETATQSDLSQITKDELRYLDKENEKNLQTVSRKTGARIGNIYPSQVKYINGKYCLYTKNVISGEIQELYVYMFGNKNIKLMTKYKAEVESYLKSTTDKIAGSLIINHH